jgi:HD-like signal output (HDOD) protein
VSEFACRIAQLLNRKNLDLDVELIAAAGLLHDLAKGQPDHAGVGSRILMSWGYPEVAELVGVHMDITLTGDQLPDEAEVLYLADKLVKEVRFVSLDERLGEILRIRAGAGDASQSAIERLHRAMVIKDKIEKRLRKSVEDIFATAF